MLGLNNYILERESKLDSNSGELIKRFLEHLPPPVCLIAHNGWEFDFPIVRKALNKLNISLPASTLCVDSLRGFMEIDDKLDDKNTVVEGNLPTDIKAEQIDIVDNSIDPVTQKEIDWQSLNENTPKRQILNRADALLKRKHLNADDTDIPANKRTLQDMKSRRQLFTGLNCASTKRYPPRGRYRLSHMYERIFKRQAINAHRAEADVIMLTKLIQHYNVNFVAFAEEQAIPFTEVVPIGGKTSNCTN